MNDMSTNGASARRSARNSFFLMAPLHDAKGALLGKARVRNLSATGLMADFPRALTPGATVMVELRGIGDVQAQVSWSREGRIGLAFDAPVEPELALKSRATETQPRKLQSFAR